MITDKKEDLLAHYTQGTPKLFVQIDVHNVGPACIDLIFKPDADGLAVTAGTTWELMQGAAGCGCRLLVDPKIPPGLLLKAIERLRAAIEDGVMEDFAPSTK